jgi:hypothetical protein
MSDHSGTKAKARRRGEREHKLCLFNTISLRGKFTEMATSFKVGELFVDKQFITNRHQQAARFAIQHRCCSEAKLTSN